MPTEYAAHAVPRLSNAETTMSTVLLSFHAAPNDTLTVIGARLPAGATILDALPEYREAVCASPPAV
jgi:hypothetical protein